MSRRMKRNLFMLLLSLIATVSCAPSASTTFENAVSDANRLDAPEGDYQDVVWISPGEVAVVYAAKWGLGLQQYEVAIYDTLTSDWHEIDVSTPSECTSVWNLVIDRLPSGALAIANRCGFEADHVVKRYFRLLGWQPDTQEFEVLQQLPLGEDVASFSFAPDLSEAVVSFDSSGGIVGELVQVDASGELQDLVPQFGRARDGSYAPDGSQIAFFASERVPEYEDSLLGGRPALEAQLSAPWNLYVANPDGTDVRELLPNVRYPWQIQWHPLGQSIAFGGVLNGKRGTWVYDMVDERLYLVWEQRTHFDWSPDGAQMVVVDAPPQNTGPNFVPERLLVIDVELGQQ